MRGLFTSEGGRVCLSPGEPSGYPALCLSARCTLEYVWLCVTVFVCPPALSQVGEDPGPVHRWCVSPRKCVHTNKL